MVADGVILGDYFLENIRVSPDVVANAKKSCLCIYFCEFIQYPFRWARNRAIVKGQVNLFFLCGYIPD